MIFIHNMFLSFIFIFSFSLDECHKTLVQIGVRDLTSATVARIIGMMVKSCGGTHDPVSMQVCTKIGKFLFLDQLIHDIA